MGDSDQPLDGPDPQEDSTSSHLGILSGRMILAVLVSPWFGVGFLYGFQEALNGAVALGGTGASGWQLMIMFSMMAVGPTTISLSLSPNLRGVLAATIATFVMVAGFLPIVGVVGEFTARFVPSLEATALATPLPMIVFGAIPMLIALPVAGYVHRRQGYAGLSVGIIVGGLVTLLYGSPGPWQIIDSSGSGLLRPSILLNSGASFAFVWSSAIFFPELFRRRIGWAGLVVWAVLQGTIFALGPLLNLLATV